MGSLGKLAFRLGFVVAALLSLTVCPARAALLNGGFEQLVPDGSPLDWQVVGSGIVIDTVFPNTGQNDVAFTDVGVSSSTLSQTIATNPGTSFLLEFALLDEAGESTDGFTASFGGFSQTLTGDEAAPPGDTPAFYTDFSLSIPGSAITDTSTTLSFSGFVDPTDPTAWNLDDVSLIQQTVAAPEPASGMVLAMSLLATWTLCRRMRNWRN